MLRMHSCISILRATDTMLCWLKLVLKKLYSSLHWSVKIIMLCKRCLCIPYLHPSVSLVSPQLVGIQHRLHRPVCQLHLIVLSSCHHLGGVSLAHQCGGGISPHSSLQWPPWVSSANLPKGCVHENGHILGLSSSYYTKASVTWYNVLLQNVPNIIDSAGSDIDKYEPECKFQYSVIWHNLVC